MNDPFVSRLRAAHRAEEAAARQETLIRLRRLADDIRPYRDEEHEPDDPTYRRWLAEVDELIALLEGTR